MDKKNWKSILAVAAVAAFLVMNLVFGVLLVSAVREIWLHAPSASHVNTYELINAILTLSGQDNLFHSTYVVGRERSGESWMHTVRAVLRDPRMDTTAELHVIYWYQDERRETSAAMDWVSGVTLEGQVTLPDEARLEAHSITLIVDGISRPSEIFINWEAQPEGAQ